MRYSAGAGAGSPDDLYQFHVDTTPPETVIDSQPESPTAKRDASVTFHADDPLVTFSCYLDGAGGFFDHSEVCTSPATYVVCPFYSPSLPIPIFALRSEKTRRLSIDAAK